MQLDQPTLSEHATRLAATTLLALLCLALRPPLGLAQDRHARTYIEWDDALVASGCSERDALVSAVEARIGRPLGARTRDEAELILQARRADADGMVAELTLIGAGGVVLGVRRIETTETGCETLNAGLPLVIAMLVDLHEHDAVVTLPADVPVVPIPAPVPAPVAVPPAPRLRERLWGSLETGASVDIFGLPLPAIGLEILTEFGAELSPLSGMIRAAFVMPQTSQGVGEVEVTGGRGALGGCLRAEPTGLALGGCLLVEGGLLRVTGRRFDVSRVGNAPHLAAMALFEGVLLVFLPFTVRVELGVSVPFIAQRFVYDEAGGESAIFVASPVTLRAALLVGLRVW